MDKCQVTAHEWKQKTEITAKGEHVIMSEAMSNIQF